MNVSFSDGVDIVGCPVIKMKHLARDPKTFRYLLQKGTSFLLTNNWRPVAMIHPLSEEKARDDMNLQESDEAVFMTIEQIRNERDKFLFTMMEGKPVILFFYNRGDVKKQIAFFNPDIPEDILAGYQVYRRKSDRRFKQDQEDQPDEREEPQTKKTEVLSVNEFRKNFFKIRLRIYRGEELLVTYRSYPLFLVRPINEDDNVEEIRTINVREVQHNQEWLIREMSRGHSFKLAYYNDIFGIATPEIPKEVLDRALSQGVKLDTL